MINLDLWVNMVKLKIFRAATFYALFADEPRLTPSLNPFELVLSLLARIFQRHALSVTPHVLNP